VRNAAGKHWGEQKILKAPFTRYNLLSNRLSNPFDNRFDKRLYGVYSRLSTGCTAQFDSWLNEQWLTEQWLFVQHGCQTGLFNRFDNRVERTAVRSTRLSNRLSKPFDNRFDNRLYRGYEQPFVKLVVQPV